MFHIVFDSRGAELLNAAMDLDETLDGEVIYMQDDYSIGPIQNLFSDEGRIERKNWWQEIGQVLNTRGEESSDSDTLMRILQRMKEEEFDQIWIWVAPNIRDMSGYFWLISQLKDFSGRIYILSLNNLPFINEKGNLFYPVSLSEIPAREFVKAQKLVRPVHLSEFETDPDEWSRLAAENKNLRRLEGGKKITQEPDDFYDRQILQAIQPGFQKIQRTVQHITMKSSEKLNESFVAWRLKVLVASGLAEQQGETIRLVVRAADEVGS
jgi:hypothetical protein